MITGMGIVSCLGNSIEEVASSLFEGSSGIETREEQVEMGMRSQIAGAPKISVDEFIDRKQRRFMGDAASYAYISMLQAIEDSGLEEHDISNLEELHLLARRKPQIFFATAVCVE